MNMQCNDLTQLPPLKTGGGRNNDHFIFELEVAYSYFDRFQTFYRHTKRGRQYKTSAHIET